MLIEAAKGEEFRTADTYIRHLMEKAAAAKGEEKAAKAAQHHRGADSRDGGSQHNRGAGNRVTVGGNKTEKQQQTWRQSAGAAAQLEATAAAA